MPLFLPLAFVELHILPNFFDDGVERLMYNRRMFSGLHKFMEQRQRRKVVYTLFCDGLFVGVVEFARTNAFPDGRGEVIEHLPNLNSGSSVPKFIKEIP